MIKKKDLSEWYHSSLFFRKENAGEKKGKSLRGFYRIKMVKIPPRFLVKLSLLEKGWRKNLSLNFCSSFSKARWRKEREITP